MKITELRMDFHDVCSPSVRSTEIEHLMWKNLWVNSIPSQNWWFDFSQNIRKSFVLWYKSSDWTPWGLQWSIALFSSSYWHCSTWKMKGCHAERYKNCWIFKVQGLAMTIRAAFTRMRFWEVYQFENQNSPWSSASFIEHISRLPFLEVFHR